MDGYRFTQRWFDEVARSVWERLLPQLRPRRMLEVGSFEGASACFLVEQAGRDGDIELHCVDNWGCNPDDDTPGYHPDHVTPAESSFRHNIGLAIAASPHRVTLEVHKRLSTYALADLYGRLKRGYFDFIYIDGSHEGPDVLCDAAVAFNLLRVGGIMIFDDYLWQREDLDVTRVPKLAIDSFVNINHRKLSIIPGPLYQLIVRKRAH